VKRHWWDAVFDRAVVNSALVTAPRHQLLKAVWFGAVLATLLAYAYLVTWHLPLTLAVLWLPLLGLVALEGVVVRALAGPVRARHRAVLEGLRAELSLLGAAQPDIAAIELKYPVTKSSPHIAQVVVSFELDSVAEYTDLAPQVRNEIIGVLWRSRIHPLDEVWIWFGTEETISLNKGVAAEELRRRLGHGRTARTASVDPAPR
jgi:hypothetical protein